MSAEWGGDPTYWLEVNSEGHAERQVEVYPNGNILRYHSTHREDEFGGLSIMVVDGDEDWWEPYKITHEEFEMLWATTAQNENPDSV